MDEEGLALPEPSALEDVGPDREEGLGDAGGLDHREALGHRQALPLRRGAVLGIAAAGDERADAVAALPALHVIADRDDRAGDLEPRYVRRAGRRLIHAPPLQHVGPVHPGGRDLDEHLVRPDLRHVALRRLEDAGLARRGDLDGGHLVRELHRRFRSRGNVSAL